MHQSVKTGMGFGITSATITTLGLMVGLNAGTHSRLVVIGGILTIAIADAFSDALGIHVSQESNSRNKTKDIWSSTISTFFTKLSFALTFIVPVLFFDLQKAIIIDIFWGLLALSVFSYRIAKTGKIERWKAVFEHLFIAIIVIIISNYVGQMISLIFG
jgi:VIT1/CCC1 family predicted Fe2+/Mn2+ transporter